MANCAITGTLEKATGEVLASGTLYVSRGEVTGQALASTPTKITADSNGAVSFNLVQGSIVTVKGNFVIGNYDFTNGLRMYVPAQSSLSLTNLQTVEDALAALTSTTVSAPADAKFIIQTANASLSNAQVLGSLATGLVKNTTTTGVLSIAVAGTDYLAAGAVTGSGLTMATGKLLGRYSASTGAVQEITISTGLSLDGSGNLTASGSGGAWGSITGTLSSQTDLQSALDLKANLISPSFTTPTLGVATATSINKLSITAPATSATLAIADGKTATFSNTLTFAGTDGSTLNVGAGGTLAAVATSGSASDLGSGTLPDARFPATLPAASGVNLTALNASNLASGTVPLARLSGITNTEISASAAIAYSKLALTGAILNADLAGSIAYSKLSLTGAILNADLAGSIANAKLANSAITIAGTSTSLGSAITLDTITGLSSTGLVKRSAANTFAIAVSGTDYEVPITFSTGLTRSTNTITVNTSQNIATLSNLTSNGIVTTSGGAGTLSVTATTGSGNVVLATSPTLVTPALGTPSALVLTNATGLPLVTGISGWPANASGVLTNNGSGTLSWAATGGSGTVTSVAQSFTGGLISVSGSPITTSGTLALTVAGTSGGIPYFSSTSAWASSALLAANAIMIGGGASTAPSTTTTGTGVLTALGVNVGSAGAFVTFNGALGTPSSGTLTNATGLPISTGVSGLGTGIATFLATPSSANLASAVTDETGSGALVFGTSPTLTGGTHTALTGLAVRSTGAAFDLTFASSEVLTAGRTLSFVLGDAARTLTIGASASVSGTNTGDQTSVTGNAGTATALQNARTINGTSFDGTANITVTAAAGTLTGTTLNATVVSSSLTSHGTITSGGLGAGAVIGGVTMTLGSDATGDVYYRSGGVLTRLPIGTANQLLRVNAGATAPEWATVSGSGTVTSVSVTTANGVSGSVATATTTPAITLTLGDITPTSVVASTAGLPYSGTNTTNSASLQALLLRGARSGVTANDEAYASLSLANSASAQKEVARITWAIPTNTAASEEGRIDFSAMKAGTLAKRAQINGTDFSPSTSDGLALGTGSLMWSDLFLASGGVINFNNGNVTITHSAGLLTVNSDLIVQSAGTASGSVLTTDGAQTLTNKTMTSSTNTLGGVTMTLGSDATGDIYYRSGGKLTRLGVGTSGQVLTVAAGIPSWATAGGGSGTVTNTGTVTANGFVFGNGGVDIKATAAATNGQLLIGSTSANPVAATLTAAADITVTNAAGSITLGRTTNATSGFYWLNWQEMIGSGSGNIVAVAGTNNQVRVCLVYLNRKITLDRIALRPTTNGTGTAGFGVYSADGNTLYLSTGSNVTTTSWSGSGVQTYTLSTSGTLDPGYYYFAWTADNTSAVLNSGAFDSNTAAVDNGGTIMTGTAANASSSGVLPSTLGVITTSAISNFPLVKFYKN